MDEISSMEQQLMYIKKKHVSQKHVSIDHQSKPTKLMKPIYSIQYCPKPICKNNNYPVYTNHLSSKVMRICHNDDIVWALMKTLNNNLAKNFPTWSTYNYILADEKPTSTHCLLPIIQGTPADWSNLYLAIASSVKLIVNIGQNSVNSYIT